LDERGKIFWHEAFFEALQLELHQYMDYLKFQNEHQLSKEALRMDVLIIKKDKGVRIEKNIGRIFREHNIFEFKSESDSFSLWDYNKVFGYAYLYSSFEKAPVSEITVSIALTMFPRELVKFLENERGLKVQDLGDGLYYVDGEIFPVQILESKRLSPLSNVFLRNLRSNLSAEDISNTLKLGEEYNLLDKNVYLDRLIKANPGAFKEAMNMISEAAKEIFLEGAEKHGWLNDRDEKNKKETAKKLLLLGDSVEKVVGVTELPIETVRDLFLTVQRKNI
jgi:hypothetical protein